MVIFSECMGSGIQVIDKANKHLSVMTVGRHGFYIIVSCHTYYNWWKY